jgi:hypothetical protein
LRRVVAFLRRDPRSDELLSFERVRRELGTAWQAYLGRQSVPISKIVGSVGRHGDFDGAFLPSKGHLRERWQRINRMWRRGGGLPPVRLYKIGDAYFVSDGHHRVSVASYHGIEWIDARVTELYGPSAPETRPPALRRHIRMPEEIADGVGSVMGPHGRSGPRSTKSPANYRRSSGGSPREESSSSGWTGPPSRCGT